MVRRRRVWFDPVIWPVRLRWALFAPLSLAIAAFITVVYGTFNQYIVWAPPWIMRGVLAGCVSIGFIFSAAYIAPKHKRLIAGIFAILPVAAGALALNLSGFLRAGQLTSLGYYAGTVIALFIVFNYRSEESLNIVGRQQSTYPRSFLNRGP
jgi:hypothetical protein